MQAERVVIPLIVRKSLGIAPPQLELINNFAAELEKQLVEYFDDEEDR